MRIALFFLQSPKSHLVPNLHFWRRHLLEGCREAGHECLEIPDVDWLEGLLALPTEDLFEAWRSRTWETIEAYVKREHKRRKVDLLLGQFYPKQVEASTIQELQRIGIPCVNMFWDNLKEFDAVPNQYQPFALHWVPEFDALPMYRQAGLPHLHAPMPCWVPPTLRATPSTESSPAVFIGKSEVVRHQLLGKALSAGADFMIYGAGWKPDPLQHSNPEPRSVKRVATNQFTYIRRLGWRRFINRTVNKLFPPDLPEIPSSRLGAALSIDDYERITREAIVTIGVNGVSRSNKPPHRPPAFSRLRDIEAPMLGACYLTEWCRGLDQLFDLGKEVETYRSPEELAIKLGQLIREPQRRRQLRVLGQRRALEEHSVGRTIGKIAQRLCI
jgi:glycosyl transferase family 1